MAGVKRHTHVMCAGKHSRIEEEILVPMTYRMEQNLYKKIDDLVKLN